MMEAVNTSETSVKFCDTTQRNIPEDKVSVCNTRPGSRFDISMKLTETAGLLPNNDISKAFFLISGKCDSMGIQVTTRTNF